MPRSEGTRTRSGRMFPSIPRQIDEDLAQLKHITDCVRTYSIDHGLDQIPEIAQRHGMKVLQGLWLSNRPDRSRYQVETAIALAKRFPDVIAAVIVGNEVLLRGEMSGARTRPHHPRGQGAGLDAGDLCRRVGILAAPPRGRRGRRFHHHPYPALLGGLPHPGARRAAVMSMPSASRSSRPFPDKDILVGEFGWPSAGRMREGALPSPVNQARVMHEVLALARRENYRVNLIEAYDQPWKRQLEGTVGGHWGLYRRLPARSPSSPGVARSPTIRTGAGRRRAAWGSPPLVFAVALAGAPAHRGAAGRPPAGAAHRGHRHRVRNPDRLDDRERTARKPNPRRLAPLARLDRRRADGAAGERCRAGVGRKTAGFRPDPRSRGATPAPGDTALARRSS